jgi:hypothetical protein
MGREQVVVLTLSTREDIDTRYHILVVCHGNGEGRERNA